MNYLNPTDCARLQDEIMAQPFIGKEKALAYMRELDFFELMLIAGHYSRTCPKNNLWIRLRLMQSGMAFIIGRRAACHAFYRDAVKWMKRNTIQGPRYIEGWSYFKYVRSGFDWHSRVACFVDTETRGLLDRIKETFHGMLAPDGKIISNDTSFGDALSFRGTYPSPIISSASGITIYRFPPDGFFMVAHAPEIASFRFNRHVNFDFGAVWLYMEGRWILPPWDYKGYADKMAGSGKDPSVFNTIIDNEENPAKPNGWRKFWRGPTLATVAQENMLRMSWGSGSQRNILMGEKIIDISDDGPGFSCYNEAQDNGVTGSRIHLLDGFDGQQQQSDWPVTRHRITGNNRHIRIYLPSA